MTVVKRDYYEVLGIAAEADNEAIRRAFHALARQWHPDVADAPDAEERFRELAEAYSILSNREARLLYDRYGYRGRGNHAPDVAPSQVRSQEVLRGESVYTEIQLRSFEAAGGTRRLLSFNAAVRCVACRGCGTAGLLGPQCERCGGTGTVRAVRRIRLRIPPGLDGDTQLRVVGEGSDAGAGSVPGDLFVRVHVLPPPRDPRAVRHVALALLLVAVGTLVLYLIR